MNSYLNKHNLISVLVGIVLGSLALYLIYNPFKSESNDNGIVRDFELKIDSLNADIRKSKLMVDSLTGVIDTRDSNIVLLKMRIDSNNVKLLEYDKKYKMIKYEKVNPNNLNISDKYKFISERYSK